MNRNSILYVVALAVILLASCAPTASGSSTTPITIPECGNNPTHAGICLQRTVVIDDVGQVFRSQSFEPPAEKPEYIEMSVQQMVPGFLPFSKWDWGEFYTTHLDPTSIASWGNQAQDCEVNGTEFTQELAYNSVTWTGTKTDEVNFAGLGGSYIHFKDASLTDITMQNSLRAGSCYSDLYIRADLVK